ncbi:MAG: hypothetical protein SGPRY_002335 [Prymnesium sp.]
MGGKQAPLRLRRRVQLPLLLAAGVALWFVLLRDPSFNRPIVLRNAAGAEAHVLRTGAIIQRLLVPDRTGRLEDVVLGLDSEAQYLTSPYFGAVVGRVANRIANATFELDGKTHSLATNEAGMPGSLHGGRRGFDKVRWNIKQVGTDFVLLEYHSPDGEEGYPGAVDVLLRYEMSPRSELVFEVKARTTKPTPINIAQHTYFNLAVRCQKPRPCTLSMGHSGGSILDHELTLHRATYMLPIDAHRIPTGELMPVKASSHNLPAAPEHRPDYGRVILLIPAAPAAQDGPFDFLSARTVGSRIGEANGPGWSAGYDHCFVLQDAGSLLARRGEESRVAQLPPTPRLAATLYHPVVQAAHSCRLVFYSVPPNDVDTSNFLDGSFSAKNGAVYDKYAGVCLESEGFPDAVHHSHFPSTILRPGELYNHKTLYSFFPRSELNSA